MERLRAISGETKINWDESRGERKQENPGAVQYRFEAKLIDKSLIGGPSHGAR